MKKFYWLFGPCFIVFFILCSVTFIAQAEDLPSLRQQLLEPVTEKSVPIESDSTKRQDIIRKIGDLGPEAAPVVPDLIKIYHEEGPPIISCSQEGETRMCEGLGNLNFRRDVLQALIKIGPAAKDALPFIADIITDDDKGMREMGFKTLNAIGAKNNDPSIDKILVYAEQPEHMDDNLICALMDFIELHHYQSLTAKKFITNNISANYSPVREAVARLIEKNYANDQDIVKRILIENDKEGSDDYKKLVRKLNIQAENINIVLSQFNGLVKREAGDITQERDRDYINITGEKILQNFNAIDPDTIDIQSIASLLGKGNESEALLKIAEKLGARSAPVVPVLAKDISWGRYHDEYQDLATRVLEAVNNKEARNVLKKCKAIGKGYYAGC